DRHQQVGVGHGLRSGSEQIAREHVTEPDDVRALERPAGTVNVGQRSVVARLPLSTPLAARPPEAPVELEDVSAARPLMEAVDVLRAHHGAGPLPLQLRNAAVPRVRLAASDAPAPIVVDLPDPARVPIEGGLTGVRLVVVLFPDPSAT